MFMSQEADDPITAKSFIKILLQPDPAKRPTAAQAYEHHVRSTLIFPAVHVIYIILQWLTTHKPSEEHDLAVGLRVHFDPRAQWRSAISSARALGKLGSGSSSRSRSSTASGGWLTGVGVDSDADREVVRGRQGMGLSHDPGSNEHVHVVGAEREEGAEAHADARAG